MGGCRLPFSTPLQFLANPVPVSCEYGTYYGKACVWIIYDQDMDVTVWGPNNIWDIHMYLSNPPVTAKYWEDIRTLRLETALGSPALPVTVELLQEHQYQRSIVHDLVQPFGPVTCTAH